MHLAQGRIIVAERRDISRSFRLYMNAIVEKLDSFNSKVWELTTADQVAKCEEQMGMM